MKLSRGIAIPVLTGLTVTAILSPSLRSCNSENHSEFSSSPVAEASLVPGSQNRNTLTGIVIDRFGTLASSDYTMPNNLENFEHSYGVRVKVGNEIYTVSLIQGTSSLGAARPLEAIAYATPEGTNVVFELKYNGVVRFSEDNIGSVHTDRIFVTKTLEDKLPAGGIR